MEMETHPVTVETKISKCSIYYKTPETFLYPLLIPLAYFFNEIISYFIYIFQSKFLTYVFFRHDYIFSDTLLC